MSTIFRQRALDAHTSLDHLDQRIQIISHGLLLAFAALLLLVISTAAWSWFGMVTTTVAGAGLLTTNRTGVNVVAAARPGLVTEILRQPGDPVQAGQPILRLLDGDGSVDVPSLMDGHLADLRVAPGQFVATGMTVATVSSAGNDFVVLAFVPPTSSDPIEPGMRVEVMPTTINAQEYGSMPGTVLSVSESPVSQAAVQTLLQDSELAAMLTGERPSLLLTIDIFEDPDTPSGFRWNIGDGPPFTLSNDTMATVAITVAEQRPIALVLPRLFAQ